jgi:hypothetical protein
MNALERLGLEVAAFQLLGSRSKAATLCALINASGVPISYDAVANARVWMGDHDSANPVNVARTRVCLLRESLEDVGLSDVIQNHKGHGYALPEPGRSQVISRLVEVAQ